MKPTRLVLAALGATVTAALTAGGAVAGGVLFQSPGQYRFSETGASASFVSGTPDNPSFTDVSVQQGTFIAHYTGSDPSLVHQTVVSLTVFQPETGSFGSACFVVPDSAFTMSSDVGTASLAATLRPDEETAVGGRHRLHWLGRRWQLPQLRQPGPAGHRQPDVDGHRPAGHRRQAWRLQLRRLPGHLHVDPQCDQRQHSGNRLGPRRNADFATATSAGKPSTRSCRARAASSRAAW